MNHRINIKKMPLSLQRNEREGSYKKEERGYPEVCTYTIKSDDKYENYQQDVVKENNIGQEKSCYDNSYNGGCYLGDYCVDYEDKYANRKALGKVKKTEASVEEMFPRSISLLSRNKLMRDGVLKQANKLQMKKSMEGKYKEARISKSNSHQMKEKKEIEDFEDRYNDWMENSLKLKMDKLVKANETEGDEIYGHSPENKEKEDYEGCYNDLIDRTLKLKMDKLAKTNENEDSEKYSHSQIKEEKEKQEQINRVDDWFKRALKYKMDTMAKVSEIEDDENYGHSQVEEKSELEDHDDRINDLMKNSLKLNMNNLVKTSEIEDGKNHRYCQIKEKLKKQEQKDRVNDWFRRALKYKMDKMVEASEMEDSENYGHSQGSFCTGKKDKEEVDQVDKNKEFGGNYSRSRNERAVEGPEVHKVPATIIQLGEVKQLMQNDFARREERFHQKLYSLKEQLDSGLPKGEYYYLRKKELNSYKNYKSDFNKKILNLNQQIRLHNKKLEEITKYKELDEDEFNQVNQVEKNKEFGGAFSAMSNRDQSADEDSKLRELLMKKIQLKAMKKNLQKSSEKLSENYRQSLSDLQKEFVAFKLTKESYNALLKKEMEKFARNEEEHFTMHSELNRRLEEVEREMVEFESVAHQDKLQQIVAFKNQFVETKKSMEKNMAEREEAHDKKIKELEEDLFNGSADYHYGSYGEEMRKFENFVLEHSRAMKEIEDQIKLLDENIEFLEL